MSQALAASLFSQASLGGHVRMIVTGAAPASPTVLGFLRAALGCQVLPSRASLGGGGMCARQFTYYTLYCMEEDPGEPSLSLCG